MDESRIFSGLAGAISKLFIIDCFAGWYFLDFTRVELRLLDRGDDLDPPDLAVLGRTTVETRCIFGLNSSDERNKLPKKGIPDHCRHPQCGSGSRGNLPTALADDTVSSGSSRLLRSKLKQALSLAADEQGYQQLHRELPGGKGNPSENEGGFHLCSLDHTGRLCVHGPDLVDLAHPGRRGCRRSALYPFSTNPREESSPPPLVFSFAGRVADRLHGRVERKMVEHIKRWTLAVLLFSAPMQAQSRLDLPPTEVFELLLDELSGQLAKNHVIEITRFHRIQGSRGYSEAPL